jgi:hypothetical protein
MVESSHPQAEGHTAGPCPVTDARHRGSPVRQLVLGDAMTLNPQPVGVDSLETVTTWRPYTYGSTGRVVAPALDIWLVTMPTATADGAVGTQSFAVRAPTAAEAIANAAVQAGSTQAVMRRRGARVSIEEAQATPWSAYRF